MLRLSESGNVFNVSVIGGSKPDKFHYDLAYRTGKLLAGIGAVTICGGLTGVMEAVAKGVQEGGGVSVGILPGESTADGNKYLTASIPTGIGFARNFIVVRGGEIVIAIDGAAGTLSELYFALSTGRSVLALGDVSYIDVGHSFGNMIKCASPEEAVALIPEQVAIFREKLKSARWKDEYSREKKDSQDGSLHVQ